MSKNLEREINNEQNKLVKEVFRGRELYGQLSSMQLPENFSGYVTLQYQDKPYRAFTDGKKLVVSLEPISPQASVIEPSNEEFGLAFTGEQICYYGEPRQTFLRIEKKNITPEIHEYLRATQTAFEAKQPNYRSSYALVSPVDVAYENINTSLRHEMHGFDDNPTKIVHSIPAPGELTFNAYYNGSPSKSPSFNGSLTPYIFNSTINEDRNINTIKFDNHGKVLIEKPLLDALPFQNHESLLKELRDMGYDLAQGTPAMYHALNKDVSYTPGLNRAIGKAFKNSEGHTIYDRSAAAPKIDAIGNKALEHSRDIKEER